MGRPRGRPPGPKIPGQVKSSRSRNTVTSNPLWNKSNFDSATYDYLKHYKEELYRQYNQTLTLTQQMNQLGSFLPAASQSNLLNSVNFLQTMQQIAGMNPLLFNQFTQTMNQLNPNLMKNVGPMNTNMLKSFADVYKIPNIPMTPTTTTNITSDHMRQLSNLAQSISLANTSLLNPQISSTASVPPRTTYSMSKSSSTTKSSSMATVSKSTNSTFKYPGEISKPKVKDVTKTTSSYISKVHILFMAVL